jgi:predicted tellurium resistance membrane protein TerC
METKLLEKTLISFLLMVGAALMILARRYNNSDSNAGYGIAGWTIFIIICMWMH